MTLTVLVPSSLVREAEDKREATRKLGSVARAATVFRADRVVVFPDREGERRWGGGFVETVLAYAATPPYLRKEVWDRRDELEYVGVLPPLRPSLQTGSGSSGPGSIRQGLVTEVGPEGRVRVNCGLQHPISLPVPADVAVEEGERVTVRVSSREPVRARLVDEPPPGFRVERADLSATLARDDAGLRVATSRHGRPLTTGWLPELAGEVDRDGATVAFGAPGRGLPEMFGVESEAIAEQSSAGSQTRSGYVRKSEALSSQPESQSDSGDVGGDDPPPVEPDAPGRFDLWLDAIPNQGSEVVRTEEALFAVLACLTLTE